MTNNAISADVLFEACTAGDLASTQTLLQEPTYIAKALETDKRVEDDEIGLTIRSLNLSSMFKKAAAAGAVDIVRYLLSFAHTHGVPYEALIHRDNIYSAIHGSNNVAVFKELIAVKPDAVDTHMGHLGTPLFQAIVGGSRSNAPNYSADRAPIVRFLLEHGADPNRVITHYDAPGVYLETAIERASLAVVELLLQHGAQIEQSGSMHKAAESGRIDVMNLLLDQGADVDEQLWTNLRYSAHYRTQFKKRNGIVSDVSDDRRPKWSHETPLHFSVLCWQIEVTVWLVKEGANPCIADSKGWTARDMAIKMGDTWILEALAFAA